MRLNSKTHLTAVLGVALLLPVAAWAQTSPAAPATSEASKQTAANAELDAKSMPTQTRAETVDERIADMHASLGITPAQEAEWSKFAQVMRDNAKGMDATLKGTAGKAATMTALQNMQAYERITAEHADDVHKLSVAFQTLYMSLTPEQKSAADSMFRTAALERQERHSGG